MEYLQLVNWAKIRRNENGEYILKDFNFGDEHRVTPEEARFILQLDGKKDPYDIDTSMTEEEVKELLEALDDLCFLRKGRFISKSFLEVIYTLWIPHVTRGMKIAAKIINGLLKAVWLPLLITALVMSANAEIEYGFAGFFAGTFFGMFAGIVLHEFGHMFACLAYGGRVFEVGVLLEWLMPGAYVMIDTSDIKVRMKRVQINAAGIEMNFLLAGIFGIIACCNYDCSSFFAAAAGNNLILGVMNLLLINNMDGMNIMSDLLGIEDFVGKARKALKNKRYRKMLLKKGASGKATVTACVVICIAQVALPIVIAVNILGVFGWSV